MSAIPETPNALAELQATSSASPRSQVAVGSLIAYVSIARPDHWCKNVFMALGVVLAYFCHPEIFSLGAGFSIVWAVATTCLIASSNYVLNEILDAPNDLSHPVKRNRPIPAGQIRIGLAYLEWIVLGGVGLAMAASLNLAFFWSSLFLLVMGLVYNVPPVRTKELPYIDVLSESINNPIRLLLGWFAVVPNEFPPSSLLIAYWMIGAFFMASKRFSEYRSIAHQTDAGSYRSSFRYYNEQNLLVSMFFYTTCFAVFLGVFIIRYHLELILIVPLAAGFVSYYLHIAFKQHSAAQAPERLYQEKGLMAYLIVCVLAFTALMFIEIPILYDWFKVVPSAVPTLYRF